MNASEEDPVKSVFKFLIKFRKTIKTIVNSNNEKLSNVHKIEGKT